MWVVACRTLLTRQELRMRQGSKKIFHLEAFVAKVMSVYKQYSL
jgi:hypothetical protein